MSIYSYESINSEELLMQTIGGDTYRSSIFALGIFPYMISSMVVQIFMACRNSITKAKTSPQRANRVTIAMVLVFAIVQALMQLQELKFIVTEDKLIIAKVMAVIEMVTGVMIIIWLSERNTKYGIGGRIALVLVNILDGIISTLSNHIVKDIMVPLLISFLVMVTFIILENTEKRIPVQRISIHNIYADKNYLAVKLNPVGVMPVMFSMAFFMLPKFFVFLLRCLFPDHLGIKWWQENMALTKPLGIVVYIVCLYFLTILFSMILISPKDITEQFLKSGDSILNIHAGNDTRKYLRGVMLRISLFSATVMSACIGIPLVLQLKGNMDNTLAMLPSSIMILTGMWCGLYREVIVIRNYDAYQPLF